MKAVLNRQKTKQARESGIEIVTDLESYLEKKYGTSQVD